MIKEIMLIGALTFAPMIESATPVVIAQEDTSIDEDTTTTADDTTSESIDWEALLLEVFDSKTVSLIVLIAGYLAIGLKLIANAKALKNGTSTSLTDVETQIVNETTAITSEIKKVVTEEIGASIDPLLQKQNEILTVLAKAIVLAQEDTAESKLALLNCVQELGTVSATVIASAKTVIEEQEKSKVTAKADTLAKINSMQNSTTDDGTSI